MIILKSDRELTYMKDAGSVVAKTRDELAKAVKPGITTKQLDQMAEDLISACGAKPSFKGYNGFPACICTSLNEEVVHGIPGLRKLEPGDIISIDIGAEINGYHGDTAVTVPVEDVGDEVKRLLAVTRDALMIGIEKAVVDNRLSDISHSIQTHVEKNGFSIVRDYVGHGIGRNMHEDPQIPNFGPPGRGPRLKQGLVLAIEPMVNMGTYEVTTLADNWTVVTKDHLPSAHFEHTVAITEQGPDILTLSPV